MENDAPESGESLSIDEAASRFVQSQASEAVETDQADEDEIDESDLPEDELHASDEDESEDVEGETDDEDQAEEGEDDEAESEGGRFVGDNAKVRLADGTVTTIAELKSGSLRNADYTRKTQEVAEQRRALETQSSAIEASQKELAEKLEYASSLLQSLTPQPPDPALTDPKSPNFDPVRYMNEKANYEAFVQHQQYVQGLTAEDKKKAEEKAASERQTRINSEWGQLLAKAPDLNDKAKFSAFEADVFKYGAEYGYSREELIERIPQSHRDALVLKDAIAYRKLKAAQPKVAKKVENRPPVVKGGKRLSPQAQKARQSSDAISKAKQSGSVEDVTAAYLASLNR